MPGVTPTDRLRLRAVANRVKLIREHLEAMQRDVHGLEYDPWKREVDAVWRKTFQGISLLKPGPQQVALQLVRESWTEYISHYRPVGLP